MPNIQTYIPVQGMIICAEGGEFMRVADHERALRDTGFVDQHGVRIYEGDRINFSTHGHTHGPEREDYQALEVWWCEEDGCWAFGRYVVPGSPAPPGRFEGQMLKGYTWHFTMQDDIDRASLEVVPSA